MTNSRSTRRFYRGLRQLQRQLNGAKWPLLLPVVSSQSRPNAWRWLAVDFASARRGLAGCSVLSMYNVSAGFAALGTPSQLKSSSLGIETERRSPFFWKLIGPDSTPRNFPTTPAKIAGGPPP